MTDSERLEAMIAQLGLTLRELPEDAGTAALAAKALGVTEKEIVKSLLLIADERPIMLLASGDREVDMRRVLAHLDAENVVLARPSQVKEITGFAIGGVPPFGHRTRLKTLMDSRIFEEREVFVAGGKRHRVFAITPTRLESITLAEQLRCG